MANIKLVSGEVIEIKVKEILATVPLASELTTLKEARKAVKKINKVVEKMAITLGAENEHLVPASVFLRQRQIDAKREALLIESGVEKGSEAWDLEVLGKAPATVVEPVAEITVAPVSLDMELLSAPAVAPVIKSEAKPHGDADFNMKEVTDFAIFNEFMAAVALAGKQVVYTKTGEPIEVVELYEWKISKRPAMGFKVAGKRKDYYIDVAHRYLSVVNK